MANNPLPPVELLPPDDEDYSSIFAKWVRGAIVLALAALAVLLSVTVWQSWRTSENALSLAVDTDVAGLVDIYASGGEVELRKRLDDRTALTSLQGRTSHYMLRRPDGEKLAGDLGTWPTLSPTLSEQGFVTLEDGRYIYARATRLAPDLDLLVGRSYQQDRSAIWRLSLIFLLTAAGLVLAAWLVGRSAAGQLRRRVADITDAFRAAERGDTTHSLGDQPRDEIGELATFSGRAISRASTLARTHRHMSDHIAHEIRTPLTHLDNRLLNCLRRMDEQGEREALEQCRQDIRSVVTMLDSLLDIAASEARVGDMTGLEEVDLSELATDLVDLFSGSAEEAGIALRSKIEPDVWLLGERMQLTRLLSNLLDNALKYVPRGGTITLSVAEGPVIEISDNGPGVEPALRNQVFERFRSGSHASGKPSHGLGLALARAIAMRHDLGIALVDSAKGAHFVIKPHAMWGAEKVGV